MPNLIMRFKDGNPKALTLSLDQTIDAIQSRVQLFLNEQ